MKKHLLAFTLLFCFNITSQAQFLEPECNLEGSNSFEVTSHQTFNYTSYSETEWYGNLVNPCGQVVGRHTHVERFN